ncbi:MAG: RNA polymerase sigma factor [Planctomycetota bacterium]|nr:RNA polymerase sigma factor [Planctomycetota bacterium]
MAVPSDKRNQYQKQQTPAPGSSGADGVDLDGAHATADTEDMLARFRDGHQEAFAAIVGEYEERLVRFFYRLCWDRDRAEDFTQDLFLKLLRGARRYQPQGRLSTFLFRVATNLWIDFYRSGKVRGRLYSLDQVMMTGEPVIKTDKETVGPADDLLLDEEKEQLREAVSQLTEPHRLVLELAIYQQMPYAQISKVLEIPVGTVKSRMHNCVRALRACMAQHEERTADRASSSFPVRTRRGGSAG